MRCVSVRAKSRRNSWPSHNLVYGIDNDRKTEKNKADRETPSKVAMMWADSCIPATETSVDRLI